VRKLFCLEFTQVVYEVAVVGDVVYFCFEIWQVFNVKKADKRPLYVYLYRSKCGLKESGIDFRADSLREKPSKNRSLAILRPLRIRSKNLL
jgi:hypothetical protein